MAEGRQGQDSAALQDVTLLRSVNKILTKCQADPVARDELFRWSDGWYMGVQGERSRRVVFESIQEQTRDNSLLSVEDVPSSLIVGTNTTADPKAAKSEVDNIRNRLEEILSTGENNSRLLGCRTISELLHDSVPNLLDCLSKPSVARMADAVMDYQSLDGPPPDLARTQSLERLFFVEIVVPYLNLAEVLREAIEDHPRIKRDDEDDLVLLRRERHYKSATSNFGVLVKIIEDNLMGKVRRQVALSFLNAIDPRHTTAQETDKTGKKKKPEPTILTLYLRAIGKTLTHCDDPASKIVYTFTDSGFFGRRPVNIRNYFAQANALDFLSICTNVTGQIHEQKKGDKLSLVFSLRTKANGEKAGKTSFQMVTESLKSTWKLLCRIRNNTSDPQDMDRIQRELPRFIHRLILLDICSREINGIKVDIPSYLETFQKIWASEKIEGYINRRLAILDGTCEPTSPHEKISRSYADAWKKLGELVRKRLRNTPRINFPDIHLTIDISEGVLAADDVRENPIGPQPVKEYATSFMQFVTVNRLDRLDHTATAPKSATALKTITATANLREIPILVKPAAAHRILLSRDVSEPVLSARVLTSPSVLREITQSSDPLSQGPYAATITLVYDEMTRKGGGPVYVPEARLYTLVQTVLFYFVLEVLARRQDRLTATGSPTPLLLMRLSTTSATIGADDGSDGSDTDPDAGLTESKQDTLIRSQFHTMAFALSANRRVLDHGYCITPEVAASKDPKYDQRPKRIEVAAQAALRYLPATVDFGTLPLIIDKLMVFILTSAKSRGTAGRNEDHDEYVLHGELWKLTKKPGSNVYTVELHKKFTDVVLHKHRFDQIGDGFGVIQELYEQENYQHCIFLSRTPYSDRFGFTRGSNLYYCNNVILETLKGAMPDLRVYPLLTDMISGVRTMPNDRAKKTAGLFRILDWHPVVSPEPAAEIEQDASILNFLIVGTYSLLRKSDADFTHTRSVSYNVPLTALSVYRQTIEEMLKPGDLKVTLANALSALHLVLAERPPSPEMPATDQWPAREQSTRFVLLPYDGLIGTSGEAIRKHGEIRLYQRRKSFRVQTLGLLHTLRDILDKAHHTPEKKERDVPKPPPEPREPKS